MPNKKKPSAAQHDPVRITLRLPQKFSDDIVWLADHYGITQKELFDQFVEDLRFYEKEGLLGTRNKLDHGAPKKRETQGGIRKAQVVSRQAYRTFNSYSKRFGISRDNLVVVVVTLKRVMAEDELKNTVPKHKEALKMLEDFRDQAESVGSELWQLLGADDPIARRFQDVISVLDILQGDISSEIEGGQSIKPYGH